MLTLFRRLYHWLLPYSAKDAGVPGLSRDESGRFVSAHHEQVLETARKMRAQMPGYSLPEVAQ